MNTANFGSILDRAPSSVERPKPAPVGTYRTIISGLPKFDKSTKKQTEYVEFTHKFVSAGDDVDQEALGAYLSNPDGTKKALTDVTMKNTYYLTDNSLWRLKEFLEHCGFDMDDKDVSFRQAIESTVNQEVGVYVAHEASNDGTSIFAKIAKTVAAE